MKLGRPRCYTIHPHKGLLGVSGGTSSSSCFYFAGSKNFRHMLQVFALAIISGTLVLYQISTVNISSNSIGNGNKDNLCELCGSVSGDESYYANSNANALSMGTGASLRNTDSVNKTLTKGEIQQKEILAPEEPSAFNNHYYNTADEDSESSYSQVSNSGSSSVNNNDNNNKGDDKHKEKNSAQHTKTKQTNYVSYSNSKDSKRTKKIKVKPTATSRMSKIRQRLLDSIFLSVKTTKRFHETRLKPIVQTWFNLARDQTWIFTDDDDPELDLKTNGHIINTHCPNTHYRQALCCKMSAEFDTFLQSKKSWFCHFDDDNYVNVPALVDLVAKYDHRHFWYLGKPSLKSPIRILDPDNKTEEVSFWFATGGAGFCLSRALALRMSPLASGGKFIKLCDKIQLPDDVTIGYTAGHLLGQNLTVIPQLHSHFETMKFIDVMKNPHSEITFSYVRYPEYENILDVEGFPEEDDPTRFLSLHCRLFPNFSFCSKSKKR